MVLDDALADKHEEPCSGIGRLDIIRSSDGKRNLCRKTRDLEFKPSCPYLNITFVGEADTYVGEIKKSLRKEYYVCTFNESALVSTRNQQDCYT